MPPIVDQGELAGSGGYQSPSGARCARRSSPMTPGWTRTHRSPASTSRTVAIRSVDTMSHDRDALGDREPHDCLDLGRRLRAHHRQRNAVGRPLGLVVPVALHRVDGGEYPTSRQGVDQGSNGRHRVSLRRPARPGSGGPRIRWTGIRTIGRSRRGHRPRRATWPLGRDGSRRSHRPYAAVR